MSTITINCDNPHDDQAIIRALVLAKSAHAYDVMALTLIDSLLTAMMLKTNPPRYIGTGELVYG